MPADDASGQEPLDFHSPEPGATTATCVACKQPITEQYWSAGGAVLCERCKTAVEQGQQVAPDAVSRAARFTRAVLLGIGAMLLGAGVWYAVARLANLEVGLIALLLGFLVGRAVFIGSGRRGGLRYQLLAVFLTYLGIGVAYAPFAYEGIRDNLRAEADSIRHADSTQALLERPASELAGDEAAQEAARLDSIILAAEAPAAKPETSVLTVVFGMAVIVVGILTLPVIATVGGLPGSLISLLIYSFAIMQAWRMTGSARLEITGPFQVGGTAPA
jgi:hypothetical protein